MPFRVQPDRGIVRIVACDEPAASAPESFEHLAGFGANGLFIAGLQCALDIHRAPERDFTPFLVGGQVLDAVQGGLVELQNVDTGFDQARDDRADRAAGVHEDLESGVVGQPAQADKAREELLTPDLGTDQGLCLGAPVLDQHHAVQPGRRIAAIMCASCSSIRSCRRWTASGSSIRSHR